MKKKSLIILLFCLYFLNLMNAQVDSPFTAYEHEQIREKIKVRLNQYIQLLKEDNVPRSKYKLFFEGFRKDRHEDFYFNKELMPESEYKPATSKNVYVSVLKGTGRIKNQEINYSNVQLFCNNAVLFNKTALTQELIDNGKEKFIPKDLLDKIHRKQKEYFLIKSGIEFQHFKGTDQDEHTFERSDKVIIYWLFKKTEVNELTYNKIKILTSHQYEHHTFEYNLTKRKDLKKERIETPFISNLEPKLLVSDNPLSLMELSKKTVENKQLAWDAIKERKALHRAKKYAKILTNRVKQKKLLQSQINEFVALFGRLKDSPVIGVSNYLTPSNLGTLYTPNNYLNIFSQMQYKEKVIHIEILEFVASSNTKILENGDKLIGHVNILQSFDGLSKDFSYCDWTRKQIQIISSTIGEREIYLGRITPFGTSPKKCLKVNHELK